MSMPQFDSEANESLSASYREGEAGPHIPQRLAQELVQAAAMHSLADQIRGAGRRMYDEYVAAQSRMTVDEWRLADQLREGDCPAALRAIRDAFCQAWEVRSGCLVPVTFTVTLAGRGAIVSLSSSATERRLVRDTDLDILSAKVYSLAEPLLEDEEPVEADISYVEGRHEVTQVRRGQLREQVDRVKRERTYDSMCQGLLAGRLEGDHTGGDLDLSCRLHDEATAEPSEPLTEPPFGRSYFFASVVDDRLLRPGTPQVHFRWGNRPPTSDRDQYVAEIVSLVSRVIDRFDGSRYVRVHGWDLGDEVVLRVVWCENTAALQEEDEATLRSAGEGIRDLIRSRERYYERIRQGLQELFIPAGSTANDQPSDADESMAEEEIAAVASLFGEEAPATGRLSLRVSDDGSLPLSVCRERTGTGQLTAEQANSAALLFLSTFAVRPQELRSPTAVYVATLDFYRGELARIRYDWFTFNEDGTPRPEHVEVTFRELPSLRERYGRIGRPPRRFNVVPPTEGE